MSYSAEYRRSYALVIGIDAYQALPPAVRISQGQFWTVSDLKVAVKQ
jgi:hypothetical protein